MRIGLSEKAVGRNRAYPLFPCTSLHDSELTTDVEDVILGVSSMEAPLPLACPAVGTRTCSLGRAFWLLIGLLQFQSLLAQGTLSAIVPPAFGLSEGVGSNQILCCDDAHEQMIYNGSAAAPVMPLGGTITAIAFRVEGPDGNAVNADIRDVEIRMSTSPNSFQSYSEEFARNIGADDTVVFPRGTIHLTSTWSPQGPNPAQLRFPLAHPFFYYPGAGSLEIEIFVYKSATGPIVLDSASPTDSAIRIHNTIGASTAFGGGAAPVLELTFSPVPEPSTLALALFAVPLFIIAKRRTAARRLRAATAPWVGRAALALLLVLQSVTTRSQGTLTAVVPPEDADKEDSAAILPFFGPGVRSQFLYNPEIIAPGMPLGGLITEIAFRGEGPFGNAINANLPDIEIHMSTSPSLAPFPPSQLEKNVGPDNTVVFPRSSIHWESTWSRVGPNPFSLRIPLSKPFPYNPAAGSLLIEFFIYRAATGRIDLDGIFAATAIRIDGGIGDPPGTIGQMNPAGVLQLTFQPVPEPSAFALGLIALLLLNWRLGRMDR